MLIALSLHIYLLQSKVMLERGSRTKLLQVITTEIHFFVGLILYMKVFLQIFRS